ncbi:MAG: ABC transporter permease [Eubacteriales bacterium]
MRTFAFMKKNLKELIRDPITMIFGIGFPVVLIVLLSVMNMNIPAEVDMFSISKLSPGICVFGLSFISLLSGLLIATDRESSFITRLFVSPMSAKEFIFGYMLPMLPLSLAQTVVCIITSMFFGLKLGAGVLLMIIFLLPTSLLFIGFGLLFGSLFNVKQVGGFCGALLTNISAWLSGTWFSLDLLGNGFKTVAYCLPFANAVDVARYALACNFTDIWKPFLILTAYAVAVLALSVFVFSKKMKK